MREVVPLAAAIVPGLADPATWYRWDHGAVCGASFYAAYQMNLPHPWSPSGGASLRKLSAGGRQAWRALEREEGALRHRVRGAGRSGGGAIDCNVRNVSAVGATLDVSSPAGIPERFTSVISSDGPHFGCRIVHRKERPVGVKFD
jgi:hypothetical protein